MGKYEKRGNSFSSGREVGKSDSAFKPNVKPRHFSDLSPAFLIRVGCLRKLGVSDSDSSERKGTRARRLLEGRRVVERLERVARGEFSGEFKI